jgi:hypothetical protein
MSDTEQQQTSALLARRLDQVRCFSRLGSQIPSDFQSSSSMSIGKQEMFNFLSPEKKHSLHRD